MSIPVAPQFHSNVSQWSEPISQNATLPAPPELLRNSSFPVPVNDSEPHYGGTFNDPVFFYNNSIPDGDADMVCGTSNWTAGRSCCPLSIGIADPDSYIQCRMRNSSANEAYWMNCTQELGASESRCWPLHEFLAWRANDTQHELLWGTNASFWACGAVGRTDRWRYVDKCCGEAKGWTSYYQLVRGRSAYKTQSQDPESYAAYDCVMSESEQEAKFNSCMTQHTWVVCQKERYVAATDGAGLVAANLGLLALAALTAVLL